MGLSSFNRMRRIRAEQAKQAQVQNNDTNELKEVFRTLESYTAQEITDLNAKEQRAFIEQYNLQVDGYKSMKAPELEQALLVFLGFDEQGVPVDGEAQPKEGDADASTND